MAKTLPLAIVLACKEAELITISIVSHAHGTMVADLVQALLGCPEVSLILVTLNVPESWPLPADARLSIIRNAIPKGFGANHNTAFGHCKTPFFCPVNPDIRLTANPFPELLTAVTDNDPILVAPLVLGPKGAVEDSVRRFPNLRRLARRALGRRRPDYPLAPGHTLMFPDWVAGMFMLFQSEDYARLQGFDEGYFLYYEDVDICLRSWKLGRTIAVCPRTCVVHDAQRASHRDLRHLRWHLASMVRYLCKHWGRFPDVRPRTPRVNR